MNVQINASINAMLSTPKARHPAESPRPSASSIPRTPEKPPSPPHPQAYPCAPTESFQSSLSAKLFPLPKPQTILAPTRSLQSTDRCSSTARFHARDPAPSPLSAKSLRPLKRNKPRDPSSPPTRVPTPHSQSLRRPLCEIPATPLYTLRTAPSNLWSSTCPIALGSSLQS